MAQQAESTAQMLDRLDGKIPDKVRDALRQYISGNPEDVQAFDADFKAMQPPTPDPTSQQSFFRLERSHLMPILLFIQGIVAACMICEHNKKAFEFPAAMILYFIRFYLDGWDFVTVIEFCLGQKHKKYQCLVPARNQEGALFFVASDFAFKCLKVFSKKTTGRRRRPEGEEEGERDEQGDEDEEEEEVVQSKFQVREPYPDFDHSFITNSRPLILEKSIFELAFEAVSKFFETGNPDDEHSKYVMRNAAHHIVLVYAKSSQSRSRKTGGRKSCKLVTRTTRTKAMPTVYVLLWNYPEEIENFSTNSEQFEQTPTSTQKAAISSGPRHAQKRQTVKSIAKYSQQDKTVVQNLAVTYFLCSRSTRSECFDSLNFIPFIKPFPAMHTNGVAHFIIECTQNPRGLHKTNDPPASHLLSCMIFLTRYIMFLLDYTLEDEVTTTLQQLLNGPYPTLFKDFEPECVIGVFGLYVNEVPWDPRRYPGTTVFVRNKGGNVAICMGGQFFTFIPIVRSFVPQGLIYYSGSDWEREQAQEFLDFIYTKTPKSPFRNFIWPLFKGFCLTFMSKISEVIQNEPNVKKLSAFDPNSSLVEQLKNIEFDKFLFEKLDYKEYLDNQMNPLFVMILSLLMNDNSLKSIIACVVAEEQRYIYIRIPPAFADMPFFRFDLRDKAQEMLNELPSGLIKRAEK